MKGLGGSAVWCVAMITRILVTGATGHLGSRTAARAAAAGWSVVGTYFNAFGPMAGEQLDVRDLAAVRDLIERFRPHAVIHTATGRDDWRVMADGAAHVAVAAAAANARLVHVSSDAIFCGRHAEYDETAQPDPIYLPADVRLRTDKAISLLKTRLRGVREFMTSP
jgi:dTDP-4-dehydrorhamnose reductase